MTGEAGNSRMSHPTPEAPYQAAPAASRPSWVLGFLAFVPIPLVSLVIAAIAMIVSYGTAKSKGTSTENARRAANWGLTLIALIVLLGAYMLVVGLGFPQARSGFFPIGFGVVGLLALGVIHLVVTIAGTVIAGRGRVFKAPAIPFLRSTALPAD